MASSAYESIYRDLYQPAVIIGACFASVALALSIFLIVQHLRLYTKPTEQKWLVALVFMVPVYATESILSLWNPKLSLACDILRNCYESFALYSFGSYLAACLGGERRAVELLENQSGKLLNKPLVKGKDENRAEPHWSLRNFFLQPRILGKHLLSIEKFGLVQYMILKTVCAFLALVLEIFGVHGGGKFKWYCGYPYMAVVLNFSQMWALYCLVQFYNATHERLEPIRPLAKFISFKAIVFATWWQGVGITLLCAFGVLPKEERLQTGLQDFLICIEVRCFFCCVEVTMIAARICLLLQPRQCRFISVAWQMAIAAVAHVFVFSTEPYHYITAYEYGQVTTETTKTKLKTEEGDTPAVLEKKETQVEAPGTSVTESVQDIVVDGGQRVVKDVVLTINQAIGPVEKGVTKIQKTFHQRTEGSESGDQEVDEPVEMNLTRETHMCL